MLPVNEPNRSQLQLIGFELAEEIRDGKWERHMQSTGKAISNNAILQEFEFRCPGFTKEEYQGALAMGL